jgi:putative spermidine/putrescine transport system permease protein
MTQRTSAAAVIVLAPILVFLVLPVVVTVPISFTPERFLSFPGTTWSLRHYQTLANDPGWMNSLYDSVAVAAATALASTTLAVGFAGGLWLTRTRLGSALIMLALLPMIAPQVVSAMALFYVEARLGILGTRLGLIAGHTALALPYGVVAMLVAVGRLDRRLEQASRGLGAGPLRTLWHVVLPNVRIGIAASLLLTFVISWEEVVVTLFVTGIDVVTLPKRIWDGLRYNIDPAIAAASVLMMVVTAAIVAARVLWGRPAGDTV